MKIKLTAPKIVNTLIGLVIVFFLVTVASIYFTKTSSYSSSDYTIRESFKALPPIDPVVPWSLPHYRYQQLSDSIKQNRANTNGTLLSSNYRLGPIGLQYSRRCGGCRNLFTDEKIVKETLIRLEWWKLDTADVASPTKFYMKNGQAYLRKTICIETKNTAVKGYKNYDCTEKDIAVPFRYDVNTKSIMIPISSTTAKIVRPVIPALGIIAVIYCLYFILGNFIKFLIEIAQGNPFSEINIKRLKIITLSLFSFL